MITHTTRTHVQLPLADVLLLLVQRTLLLDQLRHVFAVEVLGIEHVEFAEHLSDVVLLLVGELLLAPGRLGVEAWRGREVELNKLLKMY